MLKLLNFERFHAGQAALAGRLAFQGSPWRAKDVTISPNAPQGAAKPREAAAPGAVGKHVLAKKYDLGETRIFVSGPQAVVRLLLMQRERDRRAGLDTAGFISGYPGSPLGGLDNAFLRAADTLTQARIRFQPGLNEDLAATAVWGAQQAEMRGEGRHDGVFGLWYGKGPGVDRAGDALRHANLAGVSRHGGVLALMGDDHTAESSTTAHQSDFAFVDAMMPILAPAGVQEIVDYGLYGYALSRFAGVWVGLKCVKDVVESTATIDVSPGRAIAIEPDNFVLPPGGLGIRRRDPVLAQEKRLHFEKRPAILAWLAANQLNKIIFSGGAAARIGIIAAGKSYLDVRQAMDALGLDAAGAEAHGLRLFKVGCPYPLEPRALRDFARGLNLIVVVEEKRSLIEAQLREQLYGGAEQPVVIGKEDEDGRPLFPAPGAIDANDVAIALGRRLARANRRAGACDSALEKRLAALEEAQARRAFVGAASPRSPYFCSGCPHNRSTAVPDGMRAYAGIGCHYMAQTMDRATEGVVQMGGEGANWVGEAPFSRRAHVIQNLGDGTYNHSGALAIRFAVAAGADITYKILFNGAIAMTGGQRLEGGLDAAAIARQVAAENVARILVVADDPHKYPPSTQWPRGVKILPREKLEEAQRALASVRGVTVLIYDQACATETRRRRKRGGESTPQKRVFINELVCEGCGDCGRASNCVSIQPLETEFGRKRVIDQSSCNVDLSCVEGFCPAIVTVHGARPKQPSARDPDAASLPKPRLPEFGAHPYGVLIAGAGGSGVVTVGAILGMAAHLEGKASGAIDMAGLAQKGGAVASHVKIAARAEDIGAIRIAAGEADVLIGCDLLVAGGSEAGAALRKDFGAAVVNSAEIFPGEFTRDPDFVFPGENIKSALARAAPGRAHFFDATEAARLLFGQAIAANMLLIGYAWQKGLLPLSESALLAAIEINGEGAATNRQAFLWGRRAAADPASFAAAMAAAGAKPQMEPQTLEALTRRRAEHLAAYQNEAYAARYRATVARIAEAERRVAPGVDALAMAAARGLFRLMAVKDEYEVARLYGDDRFARQLKSAFDGDLRLEFHLAAPLFARRGADGVPGKRSYGGWMRLVFRALTRARALRGTPFDPFALGRERRLERRLLADYEALLGEIAERLSPETYLLATALAALPEKIRGFGPVKQRAVEAAKIEEARLLAQFRQKAAVPAALNIAAE